MKKTKDDIIIVKPNTLRSQHAPSLSLAEQRILLYSIFKIQNNTTSVSFTRQELEHKFNIRFGTYKNIYDCIMNIRTFGMDYIDEKTERIRVVNAFSQLDYADGLFTFKFNPDFLPSLNKQKQRFLQYGLVGIANFKCRYTIYLYDFLKDSMWGDITVKRNISVEEFRNIFKLDKKAYTQNKNFRTRVWLPAVEEINTYTQYKIKVVTEGKGKTLNFTIFRFEDENLIRDFVEPNKEFVCGLGKTSIDRGCHACLRINTCPIKVSEEYVKMIPESYTPEEQLNEFMEYCLFGNKYYNLLARIKNKKASPMETAYYNIAIRKYKSIKKIVDGNIDKIDVEQAIEDERQFYKLFVEEKNNQY